jgi:hypothetical protein
MPQHPQRGRLQVGVLEERAHEIDVARRALSRRRRRGRGHAEGLGATTTEPRLEALQLGIVGASLLRCGITSLGLVELWRVDLRLIHLRLMDIRLLNLRLTTLWPRGLRRLRVLRAASVRVGGEGGRLSSARCARERVLDRDLHHAALGMLGRQLPRRFAGGLGRAGPRAWRLRLRGVALPEFLGFQP